MKDLTGTLAHLLSNYCVNSNLLAFYESVSDSLIDTPSSLIKEGKADITVYLYNFLVENLFPLSETSFKLGA